MIKSVQLCMQLVVKQEYNVIFASWLYMFMLRHTKRSLNVLSHCHTKRRTGARGRARPSFDMTPTFYFFNFWEKKNSVFFCLNFFCFIFLKSRCHTKGRACAPVLFLVWQRLRTLGRGTFSRNAARMFMLSVHTVHTICYTSSNQPVTYIQLTVSERGCLLVAVYTDMLCTVQCAAKGKHSL